MPLTVSKWPLQIPDALLSRPVGMHLGMGLEVEKDEVLDDGYGYWVRFNWVIL